MRAVWVAVALWFGVGGGAAAYDAEHLGQLKQTNECRACNLRSADLTRADLRSANLRGADLRLADLTFADLLAADLSETDLRGAYLTGAVLIGAKLLDANLISADLGVADLSRANLSGANLSGADLTGANLSKANLSGANLTLATLRGADLTDAELRDARISDARLGHSRYAPRSFPRPDGIPSTRGIAAITFGPEEGQGVTRLRKAFRDSGLREAERAATYSLMHNRRVHTGGIDGAFNFVAFELTTSYGLVPGRALIIVVSLIGVFAVIYMVPISGSPAYAGEAGVFRIRPGERLGDGSATSLETSAIAERYYGQGWGVIGKALYFSLLSAGHVGWRDRNVGSWLTRLQPTEYALRARGWVRVVSGIQSLLSVYLIAIWALTHFGRPFG